MFGLTDSELHIFKKISSPQKIQDFLDAMPINHEADGIDTLYSPRLVIRENKAHCIEAALFAAAALWVNGEKPLLMSLHAVPDDCDHIVTLFKYRGLWGAISKSNHAVLRYRDPLYRTPRELAMSYFHEYTKVGTGQKTLRSYSRPFSMKRFGTSWITSEEPLWHVSIALHDSPHCKLVPKGMEKKLRLPTKFELACSDITEW